MAGVIIELLVTDVAEFVEVEDDPVVLEIIEQGPQGPPGDAATGAPQAHAATHATDGTDSVSPLSIGAFPQPTGETYQVLRGDGTPGTVTLQMITASAKDQAPETPSLRSLGIGSQQAMPGDHPVALAVDLDMKADLVGGVIPTSQLPSLVTGEVVPVADQAAMLALTAAQVQPGDIAIRQDQSGRRWLLADPDPSLIGSWIALEQPDAVSSVNGQAGAVVLGPADVGAYPQPTGTNQQVVRGDGTVGTVLTAAIGNEQITHAKIAAANKDGAAATPSMRTLGTGAQQAAPGDDARFTKALDDLTDVDVDAAPDGTVLTKVAGVWVAQAPTGGGGGGGAALTSTVLPRGVRAQSQIGTSNEGARADHAHIGPVPAAYIVGSWTSVVLESSTTNTIPAQFQNLSIVPVYIPRAMSFDRIALSITGAGAAGHTIGLGLYTDGGDIYPDALLADFGSVPVDVTGAAVLTIALTLEQGLYWFASLGAQIQGTPYATLRTSTTPNLTLPNAGGANTGGSIRSHFFVQGLSSFPSVIPAGADTQQHAPRIMLRRSA